MSQTQPQPIECLEHRLCMSASDPISGQTRLVVGDDQGVFAETGGANFLFGDGSVRFSSQDLQLTDGTSTDGLLLPAVQAAREAARR